MADRAHRHRRRVLTAILAAGCLAPLVVVVGCFLWLFLHVSQQFDHFEYKIEYPEGDRVVRYAATMWRRGLWEPDGSIRYCKEMYIRKRPLWRVGPDSIIEAESDLAPDQLEAVGEAIAAWARKHRSLAMPHAGAHKDEETPYMRWARVSLTPFASDNDAPRIYISVTTTAWLEYGGHWEDEFQIFAQGPNECSETRRLIAAVNRALPSSLRKQHLMPLPPLAAVGPRKEEVHRAHTKGASRGQADVRGSG